VDANEPAPLLGNMRFFGTAIASVAPPAILAELTAMVTGSDPRGSWATVGLFGAAWGAALVLSPLAGAFAPFRGPAALAARVRCLSVRVIPAAPVAAALGVVGGAVLVYVLPSLIPADPRGGLWAPCPDHAAVAAVCGGISAWIASALTRDLRAAAQKVNQPL
jgi:hypothetical protein